MTRDVEAHTPDAPVSDGTNTCDPGERALLARRVEPSHLRKRLRREGRPAPTVRDPEKGDLHWEHSSALATALRLALKGLALSGRAARNTLGYEVKRVEVPLPNLSEPFDGFQILHLSDLHVEGILDSGARLQAAVETAKFDLCVITGDFRLVTSRGSGAAVERLHLLVKSLRCEHGVVGILGNHDSIEMVIPLEEMGIRLLLNEALSVRRGGELLWLVGVDDPHYYRADDLPKALQGVPAEEFKILLCHSPELFREAAAAGVDYYLCGHTHGGQICLPGGTPILTNAACPRSHASGAWRCGSMAGYTSRGVGFSIYPARLFCPPEITVHRLVRA